MQYLPTGKVAELLKTLDIHPRLAQRWATVFYACPTLKPHCVNAPCVMGWCTIYRRRIMNSLLTFTSNILRGNEDLKRNKICQIPIKLYNYYKTVSTQNSLFEIQIIPLAYLYFVEADNINITQYQGNLSSSLNLYLLFLG